MRTVIAFLTRWPPGREKVGRWIIFGVTIPLILGWLFPILACLCFAAKWRDLRFEPTLVLSGVWRPWAAGLWGYSTALLRGMMLTQTARNETVEADTTVERHEHVHVRQFEDACITALLIGLTALVLPPVHEWWWVPWAVSPLYVPVQWVTAWLRGWNPYEDSEIELSAYAQTNILRRLGTSFQEQREAERAVELRIPVDPPGA